MDSKESVQSGAEPSSSWQKESGKSIEKSSTSEEEGISASSISAENSSQVLQEEEECLSEVEMARLDHEIDNLNDILDKFETKNDLLHEKIISFLAQVDQKFSANETVNK
eukprot:Sdes_comp22710_c0_seq1m21125